MLYILNSGFLLVQVAQLCKNIPFFLLDAPNIILKIKCIYVHIYIYNKTTGSDVLSRLSNKNYL